MKEPVLRARAVASVTCNVMQVAGQRRTFQTQVTAWYGVITQPLKVASRCPRLQVGHISAGVQVAEASGSCRRDLQVAVQSEIIFATYIRKLRERLARCS